MKKFRTIEISDPRFEQEGLRHVTVKSSALRHRADLLVHVPPQAQGRQNVPVVILLHGVYGSAWCWALKGGAHRTAQRMIDSGALPPMILAMPSDGLFGDGSGYVAHHGSDYERWIVAEVPAAVMEAAPAVSAESPLFIAGLSMGGMGALRLGSKYPGRFRGISGHSSLTEFEQLKLFVEEPLSSYSVDPVEGSVFETMKRHRDSLPPIRFDCGTTDPLLEFNRALRQTLCAEGIPHEYEEFPGGHEWRYWEENLAVTLRFFGEILSGSR